MHRTKPPRGNNRLPKLSPKPQIERAKSLPLPSGKAGATSETTALILVADGARCPSDSEVEDLILCRVLPPGQTNSFPLPRALSVEEKEEEEEEEDEEGEGGGREAVIIVDDAEEKEFKEGWWCGEFVVSSFLCSFVLNVQATF